MGVTARLDPLQAWISVVGTALAALVVGAALLPGLVYDRFLWQYFWGPVVADGHGAVCAVKTATGVAFPGTASACSAATGIVAYPGYTVVSEIGYAATLITLLIGVVFLLRRLNLGTDRSFLFGLLPFMFLGGALRVVEDAGVAATRAGAEPAIGFPWSALIISPLIYFTMFVFTLAALLVSVRLERAARIDGYVRPLAGFGTAGLALVLGYLLWLATTTSYVGFYPQVLVVVLGGTAVITAATWYGLDRYWPAINAGTERLGLAVLGAHILDGVANVVGIDWGAELGLPYGDLVPKHPVNRALIDVGERFPASLTDVIGTAWPFLAVKLVAAVLVLYLFDEAIFEESPRYAILLLITIVAVGLGPGTRDMLRAAFGI